MKLPMGTTEMNRLLDEVLEHQLSDKKKHKRLLCMSAQFIADRFEHSTMGDGPTLRRIGLILTRVAQEMEGE